MILVYFDGNRTIYIAWLSPCSYNKKRVSGIQFRTAGHNADIHSVLVLVVQQAMVQNNRQINQSIISK